MRSLKTGNNHERGQILILVSIILCLSIVGMVPLLDFVKNGVITTKNTGLHTQEIYAAEAGVHDALWKIMYVAPGLPRQPWDPDLNYNISGNVNGKLVSVGISSVNASLYRVHSVATNPDTGHKSTIDSDLAIGAGGGIDLSAFTDFAMTSPGEITGHHNDQISGNVWIPSSDNLDNDLNIPPVNINEAPITGWPTAEQLEMYFAYQVNTHNPYTDGVIDVSIPSQSGPLYAEGNGNYTIAGTGQLTGAIYVVGNLDLNNTAHVNLNGKSIFVTGYFTSSPQASLVGPGAIIALGDITFSPSVSGAFIFVMSVSGHVGFQPQGNFVGAVAGDASIDLQPGCHLTWQDPGVGNLDLPGMFNKITALNTWKIY